MVSVWRVTPGNEIKWKWWMSFFKGKRKPRLLLSPPPPRWEVGPAYRSQAICTNRRKRWGKKSGHFLCAKIFWGKFPSPPQTKIWLLWQFPFSFTLRWHLRRRCYDTLHMLRSEKQTCGHTILKYREKRQVNTRVKGICHIKKLLVTCVIMAW